MNADKIVLTPPGINKTSRPPKPWRRRIKKTILCAILLVAAKTHAQSSLNLYPTGGVIGVKFFNEKKISLEPRIDFQFDFENGESNIFMSTLLLATVNFMREEDFNLYSGIGVGANIYNQAESNFSGTVPLGATWYLNSTKRFAIVGECGVKITASDFIRIKSYALAGIQFRLSKGS